MGTGAPVSGLHRRAWLGQGAAWVAAHAGRGPLGVAGWAGVAAAAGLSACRGPGGLPAPTLDSLPPGRWWGTSPERGHRLRPVGTAAASTPSPGGLPTRRCAVAILGGGVAGLAAARALRMAGVDDLQLFELEDEAGGNARGHQLQGLACPLGAHYLPVPQAPAHEVVDWLHELGLLRQHLGRTVADERHLCHSPQERLWLHGPWVEGLLPPADAGSARAQQYTRLAREVAAARRIGFALPSQRAPWTADHARLDAQTFAQWLDERGLTDPALRWYLDYSCRDDYGAGTATVSAWAGLHYFASRHGFHAPGSAADAAAEGGPEPVFTWPEGNAWLTRRLAAPLGDRLHSACVVQQVQVQRHGVAITVWDQRQQRWQHWQAQRAVVALPLHVARRVIVNPPDALQQAAAQLPQAPWLVANLHLHTPLLDKPGAPPAWDNVLLPEHLRGQVLPPADAAVPADGASAPTAQASTLGSPSPSPSASADTRAGAGASPGLAAGGHGAPLGYVDAMHQSTRPHAGPTVLTAYWALGDGDEASRRARRLALAQDDWRPWALTVLQDLARAHPDLLGQVSELTLTRYGHAMAIPAPGVRGSAALQALGRPDLAPRLHFAHADLAGYSVLEEAFTRGHAAGVAAVRALAGR